MFSHKRWMPSLITLERKTKTKCVDALVVLKGVLMLRQELLKTRFPPSVPLNLFLIYESSAPIDLLSSKVKGLLVSSNSLP